MSTPFPDEIEETIDPAETGRHGCLLPVIETDEGHCDSKDAEDDDD